MDDFERSASGPIGDQARRLNTRSSIGGPIVVAGRLWGADGRGGPRGRPAAAEPSARLEQFTELIATAIANTEARVELARLADEQAALRRVATLVAQEAPAADLFAKVAEEVAGVFGERIDTAILRYEADDAATVVAVCGEQPAGGIRVDARLPLDGSGVVARVFRERRPVRVDDYTTADGADRGPRARRTGSVPRSAARSSFGAACGVRWSSPTTKPSRFPPEAERRVSQFTELVATAIANAEARAEVQRLADEQAALRRVATLVAEGAAPTEVFNAVIGEVAQLVGAAQVGHDALRELAARSTIVAQRGQDPAIVRAGMRLPLDGDSVTARVLRTRPLGAAQFLRGEGRHHRRHRAAHRTSTRRSGRRSRSRAGCGACSTASWEGQDVPPVDAEERLAEFAELLDTAIANADSRDQLTASRARVLTAGDEARRRVVRDLHDGAQQRLVHTIVTLKLAQRALSDGHGAGGVAARRGARSRRAGQRRASRAGPRDPPCGPDARRSPGRCQQPRSRDSPFRWT